MSQWIRGSWEEEDIAATGKDWVRASYLYGCVAGWEFELKIKITKHSVKAEAYIEVQAVLGNSPHC